jgi:hypothetical protein
LLLLAGHAHSKSAPCVSIKRPIAAVKSHEKARSWQCAKNFQAS